MLLLKRSLLEACLAAARSADPNEFLGLLEGERSEKNGEAVLLLTRLIVPPGLSVDSNSAMFLPWMMPAGLDTWGTFHSHPSGSAGQSGTDRASASKEGGVHLIACRPYGPAQLVAYDSRGNRLEYSIVP